MRLRRTFESAANDAPTNLELRVDAAVNRVRANQLDIAADHYEAVLNKGSSPNLLQAYAEVLLNIQVFRPVSYRTWGKFDAAVAKLREAEDFERPWTADLLDVRKAIVVDELESAAHLLDDAVSPISRKPGLSRGSGVSVFELEEA